jgi:hypothetical protein
MVSVLVLQAAWALAAVSSGCLVIVTALVHTYNPDGGTGDLVWLLLLALWSPVVGGACLSGWNWYCLHDRRAAAVKNALATVRVMAAWWRYGYTVLGVAGALGALFDLFELNLLAIFLLVVWGTLHAGLWWLGRLLVDAGRTPDAAPPEAIAVPAVDYPTAPASPYGTRAESYLREVRERTNRSSPSTD